MFKRGETFDLSSDLLSFARQTNPSVTQVNSSLAVPGGRSATERQAGAGRQGRWFGGAQGVAMLPERAGGQEEQPLSPSSSEEGYRRGSGEGVPRRGENSSVTQSIARLMGATAAGAAGVISQNIT